MATADMINKVERLQNVRLCHNLGSLMRAKDKSMTDIHKHTGIPITTIQRICKDPRANPTLASLIPLADFFSITLAQLIGEQPLFENKTNNLEQWSTIPVITWQHATEWPAMRLTFTPQRNVATEINVGPHAFALEVLDDQHEYFQKNTLLVIDPSIKAIHRDYVVSHKKNGREVSLKQILIHEDDVYLKPSNPEFKTRPMDDNHRIVGVVVQTRMNLKE